MTPKSRPFSNTHLGEVELYYDEFFGSLLFICQQYLGMDKEHPTPDKEFLDTRHLSVAELWEYLEEVELPNGMLGFNVFPDKSWHTTPLALIKTTIPYEEPLTNQMFLNLIEDFKEYVRGLPLCDPAKREGALWSDEDIACGHSERAAEAHQQAWKCLGGNAEVMEAVFKEAGLVRVETEDDIPF